jgi:uncharacterized protein (DUF2126 family)
LLAGEGHIPLACTPHPSSAAPITGALEEAETAFEHKMSVQRVVESPRVTNRTATEQWRAVDAFWRRDRAALNADDVRVTIGGEPTFVAMDDPDAPEWNTAAAGPSKRRFARTDSAAASRFAPRGLLQYGQGKWYPGEQLPRWAFSLYWRRDGKTLWRADEVIAPKRTTTASPQIRRGALGRSGVAVGARPAAATAAYEDPWHFIGRNRSCPRTSKRPRTASTIRWHARGSHASSSAAWASRSVTSCPCSAGTQRLPRRWYTDRWTTRAGKLFLVPGDSPLGFRLPLRSLIYLPPSQYPHVVPRIRSSSTSL